MDWSKGFSAQYYYTIVDAATWRDTQKHRLTGGMITRTADGLMETADLEMTELPASIEAWIRVWLDARQQNTGAHVPLFTGLVSAPDINREGMRCSYQTECYSVLKPAADILLPRGWYAPAGISGAKLAAELLSVGPAPVEFAENAANLYSSIIAEDGETYLSMAQKMISAIGWRIRINGSGMISIVPRAADAGIVFDANENDCLELQITDRRDLFSCPNVFRAVYNEMSAVARDDSEGSILSVPNRGREVWMEERDCNLNEGESIEEYAVRRLREEQSPARSVSYTRRYAPEIAVGDIVRLHYPAQEITGNFRVDTQKTELGYGARTAEEVVQI